MLTAEEKMRCWILAILFLGLVGSVAAAPAASVWRHVEGVDELQGYSLRVKTLDPSELGVDKVKQYSGYLDDVAADKHLFYWFFESRNDPANDPVILWLNGGPGCSSLTGLFLELGPSRISQGGQPVLNPYSWNTNASVIFLDQPVNTGFSYSSRNVTSTTAAARDMYALVSLFLTQLPEYSTQPFHIAGESYAGHYIPALAAEILSHPQRGINLKSIMVGNGLTDPLSQYSSYRPMACGQGSGYDAVLDERACADMDAALPGCLSQISSCYASNGTDKVICAMAAASCNNALISPLQRSGRNVYDVRVPCPGGGLCYPAVDWVTTWLNRQEVQRALGVAEGLSFEACSRDVNLGFAHSGDWMSPYVRLVPGILEAGIPVLVYAGDADFICNWLGNQAWTKALSWSGQEAFNAAQTRELVRGERAYGSVKEARGLAFMRIFGGGHMLPMDQPEVTNDFVNRWIGGEWASFS